jgi:hypothetical protein
MLLPQPLFFRAEYVEQRHMSTNFTARTFTICNVTTPLPTKNIHAILFQPLNVTILNTFLQPTQLSYYIYYTVQICLDFTYQVISQWFTNERYRK